MSKKEDWEIDSELYAKLNYDVLRSIYDAGDKRFSEMLSELKDIRARAFTLIAILISFVGILVPMIIGRDNNFTVSEYNVLYLLFVIGLSITIWALFVLVKIVYPDQQAVAGEEPRSVDFSTMSKVGIEYQEFAYLINQIENVQYKISFNKPKLDEDIGRLEHVVQVVPLAFVTLLIIGIIIVVCL